MKITGRQSTNVQTEKEAYLDNQTRKGMNSKTLRSPTRMKSQPLEKSGRVGALEPGMDDAPFLSHTQKDCK